MPNVIDGVTLSLFDRVLVKNQADARQNGIYVVQSVGTGSTGIWSRAPDANTGALQGGNQYPPTVGSVAPGLMAYVDEGSQSGKMFKLATTGNINLGTTTLNFQSFTGEAGGASGQLQFANTNNQIGGVSSSSYDYTTGNISITSNLSITGGALYQNGKRVPQTTTGLNPPSNPAPGDTWYQIGTDILYEWIDDGTSKYWVDVAGATIANVSPITSSAVGQANISQLYVTGAAPATSVSSGSLQVLGGVGITGNLWIGGTINLANGATFGNTLSVTAKTPSTSETTGALTIPTPGGLGIGGNIWAGGSIVANSRIASTSATTGALLVPGTGGIGVGGNINAAGTITGGSIRQTISSSAPTNPAPTVGDQWYQLGTDILYQYISDGTSSYWVDIAGATIANTGNFGQQYAVDQAFVSGTTSISPVTGAVTVVGGVGISGNINATGLATFAGNLTAGNIKSNATLQAVNTVTGNLSVTGSYASIGGLVIQNGGIPSIASIGVIGSATIGTDAVIGGNLTVTGNITGGGVRKTTSITAPASPAIGDQWYKQDTDTLYQYINDGVNKYWVDITGATVANAAPTNATPTDFAISSGTASINTATGALQVIGGTGITGNVNIGGLASIAGNATIGNVTTGAVSAGAFTYSNGVNILTGVTGTYSNANVVGYLAANGITATAAGITTTGNLTAAGTYFSAAGLTVSNSGNIVSTGTYAQIGGLTIQNGGFGSIASLGVIGSATIGGDLAVTGNVTGGGLRKYAQVSAPTNPVVGDIWYKTDTDVYYTYVNDGTNRYWIDYAGATVANITVANSQIISDTQFVSGTTSTSTGTGAVTVVGGVGILGNINAGGNINVGGTVGVTGNINVAGNLTALGLSVVNGNVIAAGQYANIGGLVITAGSLPSLPTLGVVGAATIGTTLSVTGNVTVGNLTTAGTVFGNNMIATGFITGGSIRKTTSIVAPLNPTVGDQWYKQDTDTLYQYINDGTQNIWVDVAGATVANAVPSLGSPTDLAITSGTLSTSPVTGALQVIGGIGVVGNVNSTASATFAGNITGGNLVTNSAVRAATLSTTGNASIGQSLSVAGNIVSSGTSATIGGLVIQNGAFGSVASLTTIGPATIGTDAAIGGNLTVTGNITGGGVRKTTSISAPVNPVVGDIWYKQDTDVYYQYINDGVNKYWIDIAGATVANITQSSATPNDLRITSGTDSIDINSGALQVIGGAGITGNINAGNVIASSIRGNFLWANGASLATTIVGTYSNTNVTAYLSANGITTSAGGNLSIAGSYFSATGFSVNNGNITATGTTATIGGLTIQNGSFGSVASLSVIGAATIGGDLGLTGNATIAGSVTITGNITGGGIRKTQSTTPPANPVVGDLWYKTDTDVYYQYISDGTSRYWVDYVGATVSNSAVSTGTGTNLQITSGTASTNTTSGALTVVGGIGATGNINAGNIIAGSIRGDHIWANGASLATTITGTYSNTNVAAYLTGSISTGNITALSLTATGIVTGGSIRKTTSLTAPASPVVGDQWYKQDTDVLYQYINDGTSTYWIDVAGAAIANAAPTTATPTDFAISSGTASVSTATGALQVIGGVGISGNINAGGNITAGNLSTALITATKVISYGNITASAFNYANGVSILAGVGGTYSDANVVSYLTSQGVSTASGNLTSTGTYFSAGGLSVNNGNLVASGTTATIGGLVITNGAFGSIASLGVIGSATIGGDLAVTGNITGGGIRKTQSTTPPANPTVGDLWYKTDTDVYYQYISDGTSRYWVDYVGPTVSNAAPVSIGSAVDQAFVSGTLSTNTTNGAVTVIGGVGIVGNINVGNQGNFAGNLTGANLISNAAIQGATFSITGNATIGGNLSSANISTGNASITGIASIVGNTSIGGFASIAGNTSIGGNLTVTGNITGGGLRKYAQVNKPSNPVVGDVWYKTDTDVYYQYITDGTQNIWVDYIGATVSSAAPQNSSSVDFAVTSGTLGTSPTTGALQVIGGVGIVGNVNATGKVTAQDTITAQTLVSNGTIFGTTLVMYGSASVRDLTVGGDVVTANINSLGYINTTGNLTAGGNLTAYGLSVQKGNLTANGSYFSAGGLTSTTGNLTAYGFTVANGNIVATGRTATIGGLTITDGAFGSIASISVIGAATIGGDLAVTGNVTGGGLRKYAQVNAPANPVVGDVWYKTDTDVYYTYINDGTSKYWIDYVGATVSNASPTSMQNAQDQAFVSGTLSTSPVTGAVTVIGGVGITGNINATGSATFAGNVTAGNITSNASLQAQNIVSATLTTGNVSVGNITGSGFSTVNGNVVATGAYARIGGLTIQNGAFGSLSSLGVIGNATIGNSSIIGRLSVGGDVAITGNVTGGGLRKTQGIAAPANPVVGDVWYKTDTDVYYQYINDGTQNVWVDYVGPTIAQITVANSQIASDTQFVSGTLSTSTDTGALQVIGGVGISGNINVGGNATVGNLITSTVNTTSVRAGIFTYANGVNILAGNEGTYSNANVAGYLVTQGISTAGSNLVSTGTYFSAGGFSVNNGNVVATGTTATIGGLVITNGSIPSLPSINSIGSATIGGDLAVTGNVTGGGLRKYTGITPPANPVVGDVWYKTDTDVYYQYITDGTQNIWVDYVSATVAQITVANSQIVSDTQFVSGTTSVSPVTGAVQVIGGVGITGNINATGFATIAGNLTAGNITSNAKLTTYNLSTTDGAVIGGSLTAGEITVGNITGYGFSTANGNITATGSYARIGGLTIQNGGFGNIASLGVIGAATIGGAVNIGGSLAVTGNITGGGVRQTISTNAPVNAVTGDQWYQLGTDILFQYVSDGTSSYWVDVTGPTIANITTSDQSASDLKITSGTNSTSTSTGAMQVVGGIGLTGNIFAGGFINTSGLFIANATALSMSTASGAIVIQGQAGLGVGGNINAGGNTTVGQSLSVGGNATVGQSLSVGGNATVGNITAYGFTASAGNLSATGAYFTAGGITSLAGNLSGQGFSFVAGNLSAGLYANIGNIILNNGSISNLNSINVLGDATVGGNLAVTGNITGGGLRKYTGITAPVNPVVGDVWYKTDTDVYYQYITDGTQNIWVDYVSATVAQITVANSQIISDTQFVSGTLSTSPTTGAVQVIGGAGITGNINIGSNAGIAGNVSVLGNITAVGNIIAGNYVSTGNLIAGNIVASSLTAAGVVMSQGNINATGQYANIGGLVIVNGGISRISTIAVVGAANIGGDLAVTGNITGGGVRKTTSITAPTNPIVGDMWYKQDTDILYQYINDGAQTIWVDIASASVANITQSSASVTDLRIVSGTDSTSTSTGALQVVGGIGTTGAIFAGGSGNFGQSLTANSIVSNTSITTYSLSTTDGASIGGNLSVGNIAGYGFTTNQGDVTATGNVTVLGFSTSAGNITATGKYFSAGGFSATSGNVTGSGFSIVNGNVTATGSSATIGGLTIRNGAFGNLSALGVIGSATIGGDLAVTGNVTGGGVNKYNGITAPANPVVGDVWYKTDTDVYYQYINDGTQSIWVDYSSATVANLTQDFSTVGDVTIVANLNVSKVFSNNYRYANGVAFVTTTIANTTNIVSNVKNGFNLGLDLTTTGVTAGTYGSNVSIPTITTDQFGRITNITANPVSTTFGLSGDTGTTSITGGSTINFTGTPGQIVTTVAGNTVNMAFAANPTFTNFTAANLTVSGNLNYAGGGLRTTTSYTPPPNPTNGDMWYQSGTDILYRYVYDGTNSYWLDLFSTPLLAVLPGRTIGGNSGEVQFNDGGLFGGNSKFTFDKTIGAVNVPRIRVTQSQTPRSPTSTGTTGEITWGNDGTGNWVYICVATNTWARAPLYAW
jgi:filamentous hemagglutinin